MPDVYRVIIERDAEKALTKLPRDLGMRLRDAIKALGRTLDHKASRSCKVDTICTGGEWATGASLTLSMMTG